MHNRFKYSLASTLLLSIITFTAAFGDDHVIVERIWSGMGMRYPVRTVEVWLNETSVYIKTGRFITIKRFDLQKRWTLSPEKKLYVEQPLAPADEQKGKKDTVAIQRMGWSYDPVYDWVVNETQREEVIGDQHCRLIVADGDADYSSESIEFWVADKTSINAERFNERVTATSADFDWEGLLKVHPALKKYFIVRSVDKETPPIASEMTRESKVTKFEVASPPPNIYALPDGFQKANSIEELTK